MAVEGLRHERCPSSMTLTKKLFKAGARIVQHAPYVTSQMAQLDIPRAPFEQILRRVSRLVPL